MGSHLSNLQLGFGWMEDLGPLLIFLHPFTEPTVGAEDGDFARPTGPNPRCVEVIPSRCADDRKRSRHGDPVPREQLTTLRGKTRPKSYLATEMKIGKIRPQLMVLDSLFEVSRRALWCRK
jgi:hypothetical protein